MAPPKPERTARDIWDQIRSGKVNQPKQPAKPPDPVEQMKREERKLLHP